MIIRLNKNHSKTLADIDKINMALPWSEKMFESDLDNENTLYIGEKRDDKIIGYCGMWITADGADITNLVVDISYRKRGVGKSLLKYMCDYCMKNEIEKIMLEVRESNIIARNLYEKMGFTKDGIRKDYYEDNRENAVLMSKKF